jgi:hypothetical protein
MVGCLQICAGMKSLCRRHGSGLSELQVVKTPALKLRWCGVWYSDVQCQETPVRLASKDVYRFS